MKTRKPLRMTPDELTAKKTKVAAKAAARLQKEEQRQRAKRRNHLKKYGAVAALGIAATLAAVLLLSRWNKPADTDKASPKKASAAYEKTTGASVAENPAGHPNGAANGTGRRGGDDAAITRLKATGVKAYAKKADGKNANSVTDKFAAYLKARGVKVEGYDIGAGVMGQRPIPSGTVRMYGNGNQPLPPPQTDGNASPPPEEKAQE